MTQQEYEQKKRECWLMYTSTFGIKGTVPNEAFSWVFDRAYALGKQFGNSEQLSAEGEEMLTVSRKEVQKMHAHFVTVSKEDKGLNFTDGVVHALEDLFGSKCLPDVPLFQIPAENCNSGNHISKSDNKPAEPKFKVGDKVKDISSPHDGGIYKVDDIKKSSDGFIYHIQGLIGKSNVKESELEPYTEPEEESRNLSQDTANCDKRFDNILKDSFSKERRLNIAARIMSGMLSNHKMCCNLAEGQTTDEGVFSCIARAALNYTDALMAEAEKGCQE